MCCVSRITVKMDFKMKCDRVNWLRILCCIHNNEILVLANSYEFRKDQRHDKFFHSLLRSVSHLRTELVTILPPM